MKHKKNVAYGKHGANQVNHTTSYVNSEYCVTPLLIVSLQLHSVVETHCWSWYLYDMLLGIFVRMTCWYLHVKKLRNRKRAVNLELKFRGNIANTNICTCFNIFVFIHIVVVIVLYPAGFSVNLSHVLMLCILCDRSHGHIWQIRWSTIFLRRQGLPIQILLFYFKVTKHNLKVQKNIKQIVFIKYNSAKSKKFKNDFGATKNQNCTKYRKMYATTQLILMLCTFR